MCLMACNVAIEFSILRATTVSRWPGDAPGSAADTMTVGRSMSGKFWIFIARKLSKPPSVSKMNSNTAGIGLRIDQDDTLIMRASLGGGRQARGTGRRAHGRAPGRRQVDHAHEIAVGKEAGARGHHARRRIQPAGDFD